MAIADQLRAALEANNRERLLLLCEQLESNLTVTVDGESQSIVFHICRMPYGLECLKLLIDKFGAACLKKENNKWGNAPLHLAAVCQDDKSMEFIYGQLGPECLEVKGEFGRTMVHLAAKSRSSNSAMKWLVRQSGPGCLEVRDSNGDSPVHIAALRQGPDSMQFIKEQLGSDCFRQQGQVGRIAIHWAAMNEGSNSTLKWLVGECGPEALREKDDEGNTAIHLAAWKQGEASMQFIKEQLGALDLMAKGQNGMSAVHFAALNASSNSALAWCAKELGPRCLLAKDLSDRMPVHLAAQHQHEKSMQLAVSSLGPDCLTVPGEKQRTAVHFAAINSNSNSALRWIVGQLGPDCLKLRDAEGSMALHLAAQRQGVDSLRLINDSLGVAAFKLEGRHGQTVAHCAAGSSRKRELIAWIVSKVGPRSLLVPDANGTTAADLAGYYE